ncbi:tellurium resistance protein (macronuclear) [Tetrahymena thermophila SB210]|uniref:Tellurium resistance protein n=1 Tax=Tetrahymena thermophila (strain SB210) TaxID=312017 RepID=I7MJ27_TETTS|nr:tellurium resistance protein [Tetrahymena thermophila SB210]EAR95749.2 tellurium resistance protein [Tetrahymena thermophila SB210]|eukprot:XP_001015994.2 tellurium resistance protein [Tetrahymena thermophila SB210]
MEFNIQKEIQILESKSFEVRLQWRSQDYQDSQDIDLDLQCLILDDLSQIEDVVYYNKKSSSIADVKLSDDQRGNYQQNQNEILRINLSDCKYGIKYLVILICSHDGITLNNLKTGIIEVVEDDKVILIQSICCEERIVSFLPCIFQKQFNGVWLLHQTKAVDKVGKTFIECEQIVKQGLLQCGFDEGLFQEAKNWNGNKTFNLKKEDFLIINDRIANNEIYIGLGWDTECDIDSSILTFDKQGNILENIYFGNLKSQNQSIIHHGDNLTGEGEGDDEVLTIKLKQIDQRVDTIWSVITIYSQNKAFNEVSGAFCRLVDKKTNKEFCRYNLSSESINNSSHNGCIMACIKRYKNDCWAIQPKGFLTQGKRYSSEVVPIIKNILNNNLSQILIIKEEQDKKQKQQKQISQPNNTFQISQIYATNLSAQRQGQKIDPYLIVYLNKTKVLQSTVLNNPQIISWPEKIQLNLKEGDVLLFEIYDYYKFFFDSFLGQSKLRITKEILEKNNQQSYEIFIKDSQQKSNPNYCGQIKFNLFNIQFNS